jgi:hypothetical protein
MDVGRAIGHAGGAGAVQGQPFDGEPGALLVEVLWQTWLSYGTPVHGMRMPCRQAGGRGAAQ